MTQRDIDLLKINKLANDFEPVIILTLILYS